MEIEKMEFIANSIFSEGPNKNFPEFLLSRMTKSKTTPLIYFIEIQYVVLVVMVLYVRNWDRKVFE
jgi:hypothetical protein